MIVVTASAVLLGIAAQSFLPNATNEELATKSMPPEKGNPRKLHDQIRVETREEEWATQAESALRAAYVKLPGIGRTAQIEIRCAATLCELAGQPPEGIVATVEASLVANLQDPSRAPAGLRNIAASFGRLKGRATYVVYFERVPIS